MKARKTLSRLAALFMAVMLLAALAIVPAGAVDLDNGVATGEEEITSFTFNKTLTIPVNVTGPTVTFNFTLQTTNADDETADGVPVSDGVGSASGSVTFDGNSVYTDDVGGMTKTATAQVTINISGLVFDEPGVYKYELIESNKEGYDTADTHYVYLYVERNTENNLVVTGVVMQSDEGVSSGAAKTNTVANTYTAADDTLKIVKNVEGAMGDKSEDFSFTLTVTGSADRPLNVVHSDEGTLEVTDNGDGVYTVMFTLSDGEYVTVYGLIAGDTYTVDEADYSSKGYTTTVSGGAGADNTVATFSTSTTVTYTNTRDAVSPTGIITTFAPYALMVVVAAGACFFFLRRRNAAED